MRPNYFESIEKQKNRLARTGQTANLCGPHPSASCVWTRHRPVKQGKSGAQPTKGKEREVERER